MLKLEKPAGNNWGVILEFGTREQAIKIKNFIDHLQYLNFASDDLVKRLAPSHPFIQTDSSRSHDSLLGQYLFIEFWTGNQDVILDAALAIAEYVGMELELN